MGNWRLTPKNLKNYPHFDAHLSPRDAEALATDPDCVAKHHFYPFIRFKQRWTKFAKAGHEGKAKERQIRYASRADAYIFSYYRHQLSAHYEREIARLGLSECVLAYRRIPLERSNGGKCNINHAFDAFTAIRGFRSCFVIALDISSFFESIDHKNLKAVWCRLLGTDRLPDDHFAVYRAITSYSVVDKQAVYERLGHFGDKATTASGKVIKGYLTPKKKIPKQLCTGAEFRKRIAGGDGRPSLIEKNFKPYGVPQGAPISDLLANMYLLDFDLDVKNLISGIGGIYRRYSDDILIIAPGCEAKAVDIEAEIRKRMGRFGRKMVIQEEKSSIFEFTPTCDAQVCRHIRGRQGKNGLEYLGFRFDGRSVYLRDSTLSNLRRKVVRAARSEAYRWARRYPDKDAAALKDVFNYEMLVRRFGRVEDFYEKQKDYRNWTFWTYAQRAAKVFGPLGEQTILRQLKRHKALIRKRMEYEIEQAIARRKS